MSDSRIVPNQQFYGGQSADEAIGTPASFSYSRAMDHRTKPSRLSVLPGPRKIAVLNDLLLNMVQVANGNRYGMGDKGNLYKVDTNNNVTIAGKLPTGSDGMLYRADTDALYMATQTDVQRMYPMSGTNPQLDQVYGPSRSIDPASYRFGGTAACIVSTTFNEAEFFSFQPDIEPFYSIKIKVVTKGAGNLTLTLHDGLNNTLDTVTINNADLKNDQNEFVFTKPIRGLVKPNARTYHCHLVSSATGTTVASQSIDKLPAIDYELWAYRLVPTVSGFHPMAQFQQFTLIGNGNYLAVWEPLTDAGPPNSEFQRHRLVFPTGFEAIGIAVTDEFSVIAIAKYATNSSKDFQEGKLIIWDGLSQTYNQVIDVSGGAPEAIKSHDNYPHFIVNGALCAWPGGKSVIKIRTLSGAVKPYQDIVDTTAVYPNMMTVRDNLLHVGYPSITTNTSTEYGVYMWGSLEKNYPSTWNYGYVPSSMQDNPTNTDGSRQIGCVQNFGDEMYIGWKDAGGYGLDIVDSLCDPAPIAQWRALRFDARAAYKDKNALRTQTNTAPLPGGITLTPVYQIDDSGPIYQTDQSMGADDLERVAIIRPGLFKRITYGFDIVSTGASDTPYIYSHALQWDPLLDRKGF